MDTRLPPYARWAGILYLVTHVTSVSALVVYGDATDPLGVRVGVVLEFTLALGCLGTGILLFAVLRAYGPARAQTFALLRAVEAAVIIAGALPMVVVAAHGPEDAALVDLHAAAFLLGQGFIIAVNTIVLASLLRASGLVPRALPFLGVAGGAIVLLSDLGQLFALVPPRGVVAALAALPIFAFEIWLAITLIVGVRPRTPLRSTRTA
ncbi:MULTISPECIES: DUF4386 domain-containing protein [unclassified Microbacterium]|uniref:DUF4386 domain-containing protein n=1 Tax=unclassified Microbacterium TaxID=2609290 RepID=UPI00301A9B8E